MSKKFDEQQRVLAALTAKHGERISERAAIRAEIERAYEARMYNLKLEEAKLMIEGHDLGVSKSKLGRAIGTTDWKTIQHMLDLGRSMLPDVIEVREPFEWSEEHQMPNGYRYWYLRIDGDDHFTDQHEFGIVGAGYPYVRFSDTDWRWPLEKPSEEAQQWAKENRPA